MKHTISVLVENKFGVLARVAGLFSGRGYNIESLTVAPANNEGVSRMTIVTTGSDQVIEQINKQLNKLIDVIKVIDLTAEGNFVEREMILVKVKATAKSREEILRMSEIFRGKIIDVNPQTYTIEVTGAEDKLEAFIQMLSPFGIKELVRTGKVAIARGPKGIVVKDQEIS
ncbi:MAG: acetolactate synthase small subunit [Nitrospinae bacterium]|nr:acetolactate synthase small subunit [Nitrospinota bacterium]